MANLDNVLQQLREEHKQAQLQVEKLKEAGERGRAALPHEVPASARQLQRLCQATKSALIVT